MSEQRIRTAVVDGFDNAPPLDTGAPIELQFAVDLGAICADAWLDLKGNVRLHDYAAHQAAAYTRGLEAAMREAGEVDTHRVAVSRQAFAAGLMGRVQQHLFAALGLVTREPRTTH
ncbi:MULTISPECIES: hypothetical protein [Burkholderia]|uniref:hypothetical protein n=1 Tax=Burkholderia TaxID=32008 RepID=UPI000A1A1991|nr:MULTISPECIES: hypothetical protein [Burkholderia]ARK48714.1 hypothetical protein BOC35_20890 [Burkholderia pseudomallei]ARK88783.1 hypothetical protein BOC42_16600 [Burkholderia pseudomallei]ARL16519.1 hypothetical protein BOC46_14075 [Burkholderia pseudomallei]ARL23089.1 hypothetical protein BOC47_12350 [Burkholderia pseudomallei]MBG1246471.1 hypothetical protein [Burkholderia pseudomallei]